MTNPKSLRNKIFFGSRKRRAQQIEESRLRHPSTQPVSEVTPVPDPQPAAFDWSGAHRF